jgi:hypothetical protein
MRRILGEGVLIFSIIHDGNTLTANCRIVGVAITSVHKRSTLYICAFLNMF